VGAQGEELQNPKEPAKRPPKAECCTRSWCTKGEGRGADASSEQHHKMGQEEYHECCGRVENQATEPHNNRQSGTSGGVKSRKSAKGRGGGNAGCPTGNQVAEGLEEKMP